MLMYFFKKLKNDRTDWTKLSGGIQETGMNLRNAVKERGMQESIVQI